MSVPSWWHASALGAVAVAALFLVPAPGPVPGASPVGRSTAGPDVGCAGALLNSSYAGSFAVEGGPRAATNVSNVTVQFAYSYETTWIYRANGTVISRACTAATGTSSTNASGEFRAALSLPSTDCSPELGVCGEESGPYGPLDAGTGDPVPVGYVATMTVDGPSLQLRWVALLASVALDPAGPLAEFSPSAWETITATPLAGNGSRSPLPVEYNWTLSGVGWRFLATPVGPNVNVTASPDAGAGELWVEASGTVNATTFLAGPENLSLAALPTSVVTASTNRTAVDVGVPVGVSLTATGAPGYTYSAVVVPGLGLAARPIACAPQPTAGPGEVLLCNGTTTYSAPGVAAPEVVVSNGYSSATDELRSVTVSPTPSLAFDPDDPAAYVGVPVDLGLATAPGSGTPPYQDACLDPGDGPVVCSDTPGPDWSFSTTYAEAGTYAPSAWVVDATGVNESTGITLTVAAPLTVGAVLSPAGPVLAGEAVNFSANVSGGFLPGRYWWNLSGSDGPAATGSVLGPGSVAVSWVPGTPGSYSLTLAVVDARGTEIARSVIVTVGAERAGTVSAVLLPPGGSVSAGASVDLAWQAFDEAGLPATSYAPTAALVLTFADGDAPSSAWVNVSGIGPLSPLAAGRFGIPSAAWDLGRLTLSLATTVAGTLSVSLAGLGGVVGPGPEVVQVGADLAHLHLYDPNVVEAGARANRTLWHLRDQFGNPADGATVDVVLSSQGVSEDSVIPVLPTEGGTSGVWVNFTAPTTAAGVLEVESPEGGLLLGPLAIPAAPLPAPSASSVTLGLAAALVGTLLAGAVLWAAVRRRRSARATAAPLSEEELRQFVDGRERVIASVRAVGVADLARIEQDAGPSPAVADWVASLVADGTLGARTGPDGVSRFCLVSSPLGPPQVLLDEAALDRATRAREELLDEPDEPD